MWQQKFSEEISRSFSDDLNVLGLFLGGSFGKGEADKYSDIDFIAVVEAENKESFGLSWRKALDAISPLVFWIEIRTHGIVLNAITAQWQRIDVVVTDPAGFQRRGKDSLKPLIDRQGLYDKLPASIPWSGPNRDRIGYLIKEFIRVFGLLPVANGRQEWLLAAAGVELLRMGLFNLLSEEVERVDKGGMLSWSRRLSDEQLNLLASLPPAEPTQESVIKAHLACAAAFLPRARRIAEKWDIEWPQAFEDAAWAHIEREMGIERISNIQ